VNPNRFWFYPIRIDNITVKMSNVYRVLRPILPVINTVIYDTKNTRNLLSISYRSKVTKTTKMCPVLWRNVFITI